MNDLEVLLDNLISMHDRMLELNDPQRIAYSTLSFIHFLSNSVVETGGFKSRVESLQYSREALLGLDKNGKRVRAPFSGAKYFEELYGENSLLNYTLLKKNGKVIQKANEQVIGEIMYGKYRGKGRNDLGNKREGDGYLYRGRGMIQLSGRTNYTVASNTLQKLGIHLDLLAKPDAVLDPVIDIIVSLDWWSRARGISEAIKGNDLNRVRQIVNGKFALGYQEYVHNYKKYIEAVPLLERFKRGDKLTIQDIAKILPLSKIKDYVLLNIRVNSMEYAFSTGRLSSL